MAYNSIDRIPRESVNYWLSDHASFHRNLLDNPFFLINSRGIDSTGISESSGTNKFCLDRWKFTRGTVKVQDGIINYSSGNMSAYRRFFQGIQTTPASGDELTFSIHCKINSIVGTWWIATFGSPSGPNYQMSSILTLPTETGELWLNSTFNVPQVYDGSNPFGIGIYTNDGSEKSIDIDLYSVKLERGNYPTLSMEYPLEHYIELIKCKTASVDPADTESNKTIAFI